MQTNDIIYLSSDSENENIIVRPPRPLQSYNLDSITNHIESNQRSLDSLDEYIHYARNVQQRLRRRIRRLHDQRDRWAAPVRRRIRTIVRSHQVLLTESLEPNPNLVFQRGNSSVTLLHASHHEECCICYTKGGQSNDIVRETPCHHFICNNCFDSITEILPIDRNLTCPMCRNILLVAE